MGKTCGQWLWKMLPKYTTIFETWYLLCIYNQFTQKNTIQHRFNIRLYFFLFKFDFETQSHAKRKQLKPLMTDRCATQCSMLLFVCWLSDALPSALCCCLCVGCRGAYSYVRIFFTLFLLRISLYSLSLKSVSQNLTKQTVSVICCLDVHIHMNSLNQTLSVKN